MGTDISGLVTLRSVLDLGLRQNGLREDEDSCQNRR